eukprot:1190089-Prorocentrum_minimum.AAC.7
MLQAMIVWDYLFGAATAIVGGAEATTKAGEGYRGDPAGDIMGGERGALVRAAEALCVAMVLHLAPLLHACADAHCCLMRLVKYPPLPGKTAHGKPCFRRHPKQGRLKMGLDTDTRCPLKNGREVNSSVV